MSWSQIEKLSESKSFLLINLVLFLVPFLAKIGFPIGFELFALYMATILLSISIILYLVMCPEIVKYKCLNEFKASGRPPEYLHDVYEKDVGSIQKIESEHVKLKLENEHGSNDVDGTAFWFVIDKVDMSYPAKRWIITIFYAIVGLILLAINGYRFCIVFMEVMK